jgi:2-dehydro-3-deoxygluconokinase
VGLSLRRVASLGEGLIELRGRPFESIHQGCGGDSLNTAVYLARIGKDQFEVNYVTAVGGDALSARMLECWTAEGIRTELVLRDPSRLPGLYWIQTDDRGERSFRYWRENSAWRHFLQHPDFNRVALALTGIELLYVTGVSLATLPAKDRDRLLELLAGLSASGVTIAYDTNYRVSLWESADAARASTQRLVPSAQLIFATFDDERNLWGDSEPATTIQRLHAAGAKTIILKLGADGCLYSDDSRTKQIPACPVPHVIDTTAAGDAFNAGFLSGWLAHRSPESCCRAGNALAAVVIQQPGALVAPEATPSMAKLFEESPSEPAT